MVRAIAFLALSEAARRGEARASFRGFHVHAARVSTSSSCASIDVDLRRNGSAIAEDWSSPTNRYPIAYAWGDMLTDIIQPFWAIPLLAVARLAVRWQCGRPLDRPHAQPTSETTSAWRTRRLPSAARWSDLLS
jgi:hypothetical protein